MVSTPDNLDRVETAANIFVRMSVDNSSFEVPVSEVDLTKEVDVERVREIGLYPDGYAVNAIDVDGSISFAGNVVRTPNGNERNLDSLLFLEDGSPKVFDITIVHADEENPSDTVGGDNPETRNTETIENAIVTTSEYSASSGESTESSYEFMAQRIS